LCFLLKLCLHDLAGLLKSGFLFRTERGQGEGEPFGFVQADAVVGLHKGNTGQPCRAVLFQLLNFGGQCCVIQRGKRGGTIFNFSNRHGFQVARRLTAYRV
ncbi:MAG: hypothetical protein E6959_05225, partial [Eikenella corrodens]|nr:hypothetical protein [Eikenella corrodens]